MMPEIGNGLLCLALGIALLLSVYPLWGVARGDARMMASSRLFAWLLFMSVAGNIGDGEVVDHEGIDQYQKCASHRHKQQPGKQAGRRHHARISARYAP